MDLFERDLRAFRPTAQPSDTAFCNAHGFNKNMFRILAEGGSVGHAVMDRSYAIMHEAGFETLRSCSDVLFLAALVGEAGDILAAAEALKARYEDAGPVQ